MGNFNAPTASSTLRLAAFAAWAIGLGASPAQAATYKPTSDDQVLEVLPTRSVAYVPAELRALHARLKDDPKNLELAVALSRRLVQIGRDLSDPRPYGQAQAALKPWWDAADAPADVLLLRASINQFNHRFADALADLAKYRAQRPDDDAAVLMTAAIDLVTGDYPGASAACAGLKPGRELLLRAACDATARSYQGELRASFDHLQAIAGVAPSQDKGAYAWALGSLADMAQRLGEPDTAETLLRSALGAAPGDVYAAASLADIWLDLGKNAEVVDLLKDRLDQDSLLLRLALAETRLGRPDAAAHAALLEQRFAAEKERGTTPHYREQAYFRLYLQGEPRDALALAAENYRVQREPIDARLLLDAALRAGQPATAAPALGWMAKTASADRAMVKLRAGLEAL